MIIRYHLNTLFVLVLLGAPAAADAQVQPQLAERYFKEATTLCERDAGRLWGVSLCGPMVIFDQATGTRATSQPEPEGPPPRFPGMADGPVSWGGVRWFAFPLHLLPEKDADVRQQIMLHGLFHRIQPELGFITNDGFNEHLDTLEGRFWMQLEWRALRRAVETSGTERAEAIADALAFRRERRRRFPGAADNERRDEIREGLATYTGVAAWAKSPADARRAAALALAGGESQPSFVGNFEAHSGPGYGVLLDDFCRDGADRFAPPPTLATCWRQQPTRRRQRMLPWQRRATMGQRCERPRRRAIVRSRAASPSCVDASLMGPC